MKTFYHGCDFDGKCSAAIVKLKHPECKLIPINYGDEFPWNSIEEGEEVWMVDFTIEPNEDMWKLAKIADLTWIDHHKTAIEWSIASGFGKTCKGLRMLEYSGCELTWQYINNDELPEAVMLLGRYDVWDHRDERVLPFQYGMQYEAEPPDNWFWWGTLLGYDEEVKPIVEVGKICQEYQEQGFAITCEQAFDLEWEGLKWCAINGPYRGSMVHKSRFDKAKHDAMLGFWWNGKCWTFSLTTDKEGIVVSDVAKKYHGGGHKQAAGFQAAELPFKLC